MEDETGLALDFHPFSPPGVDVHAIDGLADEPKLHQVAEHEAAGTEVHEALEKGRDGQNSLARINTTRLLVNLFEQIMATSDPILCAETASNIPQQEATDTGSPLLVPPRLFRLSIVCFEAHALLIACARTRITPPPPLRRTLTSMMMAPRGLSPTKQTHATPAKNAPHRLANCRDGPALLKRRGVGSFGFTYGKGEEKQS